MNRDEEIEKLAMVYCEGYAAAAMPASVLDQFFAEGVARAEAIVAARDRYRAARQPAPETPTPRIEELAEEVCNYFVELPKARQIRDITEILRQHAATLKERKEKADV